MNEDKSSKMEKLTCGWASWRWLSGVSSKQKNWLLGVINRRGGYEAWSAHLSKGLSDPEFLLQFENTSDPWQRSKMVGLRIQDLTKTFRAMTPEQRQTLAKQSEVELKTGLEILGKDKRMIQELIELVDPPPATS